MLKPPTRRAPFLNRVAFPISGSKVVVITTIWRSRVGKIKGIKGGRQPATQTWTG
jgi:hypothetical protein